MSGEHLACSDAEDYVTGRANEHRRTAMEDYGMSISTSLGMDEAEERIRSALAEEGFGILTEIDVAATLKAKIDVDRAPYKILGACNPNLANAALDHDEAIGLLLPCNVTLSETPEGTRVSVVDPQMMLAVASESTEMRTLAGEARMRLERALGTLPPRS